VKVDWMNFTEDFESLDCRISRLQMQSGTLKTL
jgi:hypothetical protein